MGVLSALAGGLKFTGDLVNTVSGPVFDALNYNQQKEQFGYMKQMQQQAWLREDNAVQRRVADLKAAGLSPVLAAGSAAASSSPIQVTAPQHQGFKVPNLADAINTAVDVKQAITQMRKTVAEEQKTLAETVGTNINNQILEVAKENAQVKFDLMKMQTAEVSKRLGLIDAQTAQTMQDRLFKKIQTDVYSRDFGIYSRMPNTPMQFGTSGTMADAWRMSNLLTNQIEDVGKAAGETLQNAGSWLMDKAGKARQKFFGGKK